uniref:Uncharacterized protein n=1 Tax=viral metagenome TaxID=1070528 RepID=A0A6M3II26_9ZZZZ
MPITVFPPDTDMTITEVTGELVVGFNSLQAVMIKYGESLEFIDMELQKLNLQAAKGLGEINDRDIQTRR